MAHLPHTATHRPTASVVRHRTRLEVARPPAPATLEDELLARLDEWMAHHPTAASIVAGVSGVALTFLIAYAVVASSI
ncbi:hypothetical protein [Rhodococcus zopfii]|uniref:hypothetical protein n=1 Tax=Rhodococcus zopfii TaxID=43772 RepID=UPI00093279D3|nr:hypothetical protein [Rhodococcus zopfii]